MLGDAFLADGRPQRDLGGVERLTGVRRVALEGEALDLDADQVETGISPLGSEALDALYLVERRQVLPCESQRFTGYEDVGERLLHLEDELALEIDQLEPRDFGRGPRAVDATLAFAAQLDRLTHAERVLRHGDAAAAELLGEEIGRGVGSEPGGDLVRADGLHLELFGAHGGVGRVG